jgi:hypothetical protein
VHGVQMCHTSSLGDSQINLFTLRGLKGLRTDTKSILFLASAPEQHIDTEHRQAELLMGLERTHCPSSIRCPTNKFGK